MKTKTQALSPDLLYQKDAYWRAANYLSIDRLPQLHSQAAYAQKFVRDKRLERKPCIAEHGEDLPEIRNWKWGNQQ